ncbi:MAG: hypothetical protein C0594_06125 [Marinilabiliales bacterium]|nr:MAG: hypothetical protein C0594_06125 [Marinilabiliales bacterium]
MKNIVLFIALIAFLGVGVTSSYAANYTNSPVENVDNKKCEKCGKEGCDGSCCAKDSTKESHKCTGHKDGKKCCSKTDANAKKCCSKAASKCCSTKASEHKCCSSKSTTHKCTGKKEGHKCPHSK